MTANEGSTVEQAAQPGQARLTLPLYLLAIPAAVQLIDRISDQLQLSQLLTSLVAIWRRLTHAFWQGLVDLFRSFLDLPPISPTQMDVLSLGAILILMNLTRMLRHRLSLFGAARPWDLNLSSFQVFLATISMLVFTIVFVLPAAADHARAIMLVMLQEPDRSERASLIAHGASRIVLLFLPVVLCAFAVRADVARMHGENERLRERYRAFYARSEAARSEWRLLSLSEDEREWRDPGASPSLGAIGNWPWVCYAAVGLVLSITEYASIEGALLYGSIAAAFWGFGFSMLCRRSPLSLWAVVSVAVAIFVGDRIALLLSPFLTGAVEWLRGLSA